MPSSSNSFSTRNVERIFLLLIAAVLGFIFQQLFHVLRNDFNEVPKRITDGTMMNLNGGKPGDRLRVLLSKGFYFNDTRDIDLVSNVVNSRISATDEPIDNIGELNKTRFDIDADEAYVQGGEKFKIRVENSRALLGFSKDDSTLFEQEKNKPAVLHANTTVKLGDKNITGVITSDGENPATGVLVRLRIIVPQDSIGNDDLDEVQNNIVEYAHGVRKIYALDSLNHKQLVSFSAYARTDANGNYAFMGLPAGRSYEVLPLQPGFQFGRSQGVQQLDKNTVFTFHRSPHKIHLFSTKDFSILKRRKHS